MRRCPFISSRPDRPRGAAPDGGLFVRWPCDFSCCSARYRRAWIGRRRSWTLRGFIACARATLAACCSLDDGRRGRRHRRAGKSRQVASSGLIYWVCRCVRTFRTPTRAGLDRGPGVQTPLPASSRTTTMPPRPRESRTGTISLDQNHEFTGATELDKPFKRCFSRMRRFWSRLFFLCTPFR